MALEDHALPAASGAWRFAWPPKTAPGATKRIQGVLANLGHYVCKETVKRVLKRDGIEPDVWPEGLTREMFLEWFDCELSTMIWDMLKTRIKPAL